MSSSSVRTAIAGRGFLLLPVAALGVHELRYRLAYGSQADSALAAQGHGYLDSLAPWLVLLLGLALGTFLVRVARVARRPTRDRTPRRSFAALWLLSTVLLAAIYAVQELLEGVFAAGHPVGTRRARRPRRLVGARRGGRARRRARGRAASRIRGRRLGRALVRLRRFWSGRSRSAAPFGRARASSGARLGGGRARSTAA